MRLVAGWSSIGLVAVAAALVLPDGARPSKRVDVLLRDAARLVEGQDLRIAGARAGRVEDVVLQGGRYARVVLDVDPGFFPFRADARCRLESTAPLGERFLACDPGTPAAPPLAGAPPTVGLGRTSAVADIGELLEAAGRPEGERLALVLRAAGAGVAGRGDDLEVAIRQAVPAIEWTDRTLRSLARQRRDLGRLVDATASATARLAGRRREVRRSLRDLRRAGEVAAGRRAELASIAARTAPLLDRARPLLRDVDGAARAAAPLVAAAADASPATGRTLDRAVELSATAGPILRDAGRLARAGRQAARDGGDGLRAIADAATAASGTVPALARTLDGVAADDGVDALQRLLVAAALVTARYDDKSHLIPGELLASPCTSYARSPSRACRPSTASATAVLDHLLAP